MSDRNIALISRFARDRVTPAIRRSSDTITLDNLLLNIDAFLNSFRDGIAGSYCLTVRAQFYDSHFTQLSYQSVAQIHNLCYLAQKIKSPSPQPAICRWVGRVTER